MRFVLAAGNTATAAIDGISAAGEDPTLRSHTPAADAELVTFGRTIRSPAVPVSPTGCPTPALLTRAIRDLVGFNLLVVDAGLSEPTAAPTIDVGAAPGGDVREAEPVPAAADVVESARALGERLPDDELVLCESVPGGTTTALGLLRALGEPFGVSSSLPTNPVDRKSAVVGAGLAASGLAEGEAAGAPTIAFRRMGDPVHAALFGLARGGVEAGARLTLAGGTQMLAVAALLRHGGVDAPLTIATTPFVAEDPTVDVEAAADALGLDLVVTDPGFDGTDHPAMAPYVAGEAKEGVGFGGALAVAERSDVPMAAVRDRIAAIYEEVHDGP